MNLLNLPKAAIRCISANWKYLNSGKLASFEEQNSRRAICETCDLREEHHCGVCGCAIDAKVEIGESVCPVGYWGEDDLDP